MQTQCPHCQTIFRVTAAHLNVAQGHVRCSHCRNIFNATTQLIKQLSDDTASESFQIDTDNKSEFQEDDIPELLQEDIYEAPRGRSWKSFFFWGIMVILLSATFAGQAMWFWQRDQILQHPQIRFWLDRFCYSFLCTLPPTRDLKSFYMQEHVAQIHPDMKDVIQFEATFLNQAFFSQPYPDLQLTFEDSNNNPFAQRRFKPSEYLPVPPQKNQQMRPQASVHIRLELIDMNTIIEEDKVMEGYRFEFF